jgi:ribosomal protein L32
MHINENKGIESARLEHCPKCGTVETRNNVYFRRGKKIRIYIECAKCGEFVSRYTLSGYTSDKPYESILEKMRTVRLTSGKRTLAMVEGFGDDVRGEFEHVLDLIRTREDERKIEEIIVDDLGDMND